MYFLGVVEGVPERIAQGRLLRYFRRIGRLLEWEQSCRSIRGPGLAGRNYRPETRQLETILNLPTNVYFIFVMFFNEYLKSHEIAVLRPVRTRGKQGRFYGQVK